MIVGPGWSDNGVGEQGDGRGGVIVGCDASIVAGGVPRVGSHRPRVRGRAADDGRERAILAVVSGEMVVMRGLMELVRRKLAVVR